MIQTSYLEFQPGLNNLDSLPNSLREVYTLKIMKNVTDGNFLPNFSDMNISLDIELNYTGFDIFGKNCGINIIFDSDINSTHPFVEEAPVPSNFGEILDNEVNPLHIQLKLVSFGVPIQIQEDKTYTSYISMDATHKTEYYGIRSSVTIPAQCGGSFSKEYKDFSFSFVEPINFCLDIFSTRDIPWGEKINSLKLIFEAESEQEISLDTITGIIELKYIPDYGNLPILPEVTEIVLQQGVIQEVNVSNRANSLLIGFGIVMISVPIVIRYQSKIKNFFQNDDK